MVKSSANPVLAEVMRAGEIESRHRGAVAILGHDGAVQESWGNCDALIFPRSSFKMLQALPLIETGAADRFELAARELALACSSHNSEPRQVNAIAAWLEKIGCKDSDLACGGHRPYHPGSADIMIRRGDEPRRIHNNCSGKHTGFLTIARHLDLSLDGYEHPDHPVQKRAISTISELSDFPVSKMTFGIDGCSAPALTMPLNKLALAYARLSSPSGLASEQGEAARRLFRAVTSEPYFVAGSGQACSVLIEEAAGRVAVKTGAEAVYTAVIPDLKLGIALKIDDGSGRASECVITALLVRLGVLDPDSAQVRQILNPVLRNRAGIEVGEIRPAKILT